MHKVTKILLKLLSVALLFLIFCPIVLTLVVSLPSVQNYVVDRATEYVSEQLQTRVEIDRIRLGALGSLRIDGLYIEDYEQDTLLYAGKVKVFLSGMPDKSGVKLRNGILSNVKLNLRETASGEMNIKQVVNHIPRKQDTVRKPFVLRVEDVRLDNINVLIERAEHRNPTYGVDYGNMHIKHISAFVDNFYLDGGEIGGYIRNFAAVERSGFMVQNFTGRFAVDKGVIDLRDFEVMARNSDVRLRSLKLTGDGWEAYKDFIHNVTIEGELYRTAVSTNDIAYFAPRLLPWNLAVRESNVYVKGTVADLMVDVENITFGENSKLDAEVNLRGLPNIKSAGMAVKLHNLSTGEHDLNMLLAGITGKPLPSKVREIATSAGELILAGEFSGGLRAFSTDMNLVTQAGSAQLTAQFENNEQKRIIDDKGVEKLSPASSIFEADAELRHIDLGQLLNKKVLGNITGDVHFGGVKSSAGLRGQLRGEIGSLGFNDSDYTDLWVSGTVDNKSFSGEVSSDGEPLKFNLTGRADLNGEHPVYDLRLKVDDADLCAMNINKRDSVSHLSLNAELYAMGRNIDEMSGSLNVHSAEYRYAEDTLRSSGLRLISHSTETRRELNFTSEYADATFTGPTTYADLLGYLKSAMHKYMPSLGIGHDVYSEAGDEEGGYSALSIKVKQIDPLLNAVAEGVHLANGTTLNFTLNPMSNHILLRGESEYIERGNMLITNLDMNVSNQGDSLAMYLQSEDLYAGAFHLPRLSVMGGAKNNRVMMSVGFNNDDRSLAGGLSMLAHLERIAPTNMPRVNLRIFPSTITQDRKQWRITSDSISIDTSRIEVNNFSIRSANQLLQLDGVASRQREDSLRVNMQDFEIAPLMGFASRMGYNVTGLANGGASMQAVLNRGELDADISINQMKVNDTDVAPLEILSKWDFVQQRVRVNVRNGSTGKNIVTGYYAPETKRYYAEGEFDNIPLLMLDPVLSGVVTATEGMAYAKVDIMGQGRQAKLNGTIDVEDLATTIDFTRARYSVPRAKVNIVDNHLIATSARVYDEERNTAQLNMDLSLEHLSNIAYNMRVTPRNMIVLNTTAQDNDLFYGKVYASGVATINGSKQGTTLDIVGTTGDNSKFYMPLSSKSDASQADFVTFEQPGMHIDTTNYLSRKKMMYERRNRRAASSASNMNINISLTATDDAEVQLVIDPTVGDIIKARGNGTLSMRIVPSANIFDMYGDYTITDGSYLFTLQNIINKLFLIESGSTITWTGDPVDARLNIDAIYKLKTSLQPLLSSTTLDNVTRAVPVECIINLTERLSNPTVTFDVRVPNADSEIQNAVANLLNNQQSIATQFMYLLVSGSFYSDSSTSANIGASASATTGFELLSNQVSNWLSSDDYNIILRYRPKSELTSDEIDVGFSKSLVNDRLLVEVEGNYLVDNKMAQSSNMSNFMGEAYITWLIDKAGYLKLKGFTQTIDRFDENQGLQETGVGIYYKEDFDNWTDLKRRVRDRFMSKRRREREAAEREAKAAQQQTDSLNRSNGVQGEVVADGNAEEEK